MSAVASFEFTAVPSDLPPILRQIEQTVSSLGLDPEQVLDILLALDEAITNILTHGYHRQPGYLAIEVARQGDEVVIRLRDQAPPFDPTKAPPPDFTIPLEVRPPGGVGVPLMRHFVDELAYRYTPAGENELTLVKRVRPV